MFTHIDHTVSIVKYNKDLTNSYSGYEALLILGPKSIRVVHYQNPGNVVYNSTYCATMSSILYCIINIAVQSKNS